MSQKFIEVITDHPTTEEEYSLLLHIEQIVQIDRKSKRKTSHIMNRSPLSH